MNKKINYQVNHFLLNFAKQNQHKMEKQITNNENEFQLPFELDETFEPLSKYYYMEKATRNDMAFTDMLQLTGLLEAKIRLSIGYLKIGMDSNKAIELLEEGLNKLIQGRKEIINNL